MSESPYVDLCLGMQALRRETERVRSPLAGALGIAATIYTHQVANTLRILSDVRVRHLLADEVGLGKTVQALMVLNALRGQRDDLRVLIVVPDRLVPQWRDEIMTRAHRAPYDDPARKEDTQYIRLAWEGQLKSVVEGVEPKWALSDISPTNYDVLVVDELHKLRGDVQNRLVRTAPSFEHLLVLTATPNFQRPKRHAQLFAMLEPERAELARRDVASSDRGRAEGLEMGVDSSSWPGWADEIVVETITSRDRLAATALDETSSTDPALHAERVALSQCAYRRVIRTRRADYSGVLPRRRHLPVVVEPIGAEADRQRLMWQYFGHLSQLSREFDPVLLAKRALLSPPSLQQRVDFLRRKGHERDGLLERVKPLVNRTHGDSRVDALVDILSEVWRQDPQERILVAAQDNLTVDYLFDIIQARLPMIGPLLNRKPLVAARVRQGMMTEAVEDLGGFGNETNVNLEAFQRGDAQVLFAPEVAQVGLNLQCARVLVLYSVPWKPEEVEQWIGRLDRLGNTAVIDEQGRAKTVDVYTIVQRGLVDEKVVTVLQRFHVFERSVNLDGDHLLEVASHIEAAALRPNQHNWRELEERTEAMALEDEIQELDSPLRDLLPWDVEWAKGVRSHLEGMPPIGPLLGDLPDDIQSGPDSWERALDGFVTLLKHADEFHIRWNRDPDGSRFRSLWYKFGERGMYGRKEPRSKILFSFGADPGHERSPKHAFAFITRRRDIETPPRREVVMTFDNDEVRRPLHYLNHGNPLHDELVDGWRERAAATVSSMAVRLFKEHAAFDHGSPGLYLFRASVLDPATLLDGVVRDVQTIVSRAPTRSAPDKLLNLLLPLTRQLRCAVEADIRWLRGKLPASLNLKALKAAGGDWSPAETSFIEALLNPLTQGRRGLPKSSLWEPPAEVVKIIPAGMARLQISEQQAAKEHWSHLFPRFEVALSTRIHVVDAEADDARSLCLRAYEDAQQKLERAQETGKPILVRRAESAAALTGDVLDATSALWAQRRIWLLDCAEGVRALATDEWGVLALRVQQIG